MTGPASQKLRYEIMPMRTASVVNLVLLLGVLLAPVAVRAADLLAIYDQAVTNDPVYRTAEAARQTALEAVPQSRAQLLPSLVFSVAKTRNTQNVISGNSLLFAKDTQGYTLSLTQPLYHRDYFTQLAKADTAVAQAEANFAAAQQDLIIRTAQHYFATLAAKDNLDFSHAEKKALEHQLEQTKQRFDVGLIAITDVQEAQAAYDLVVAQTIEAENQLSSQFEALHELTNQYPDAVTPLSDTLPLIAPDPNDINEWSQQALDDNLNLQVARLAVDSAQDDIDISRSGHLPQLDLNASHAYADSTGGDFGDRETRENTITLQLTLPLYEGGGVSSQVRAAEGRYQQALEQLEQQKRATDRQARVGYRGVLAAIKRVKALQQAVVSTQSALQATEAGLEVGTRTTVDVLNSRRNVYRAQRDLAQARYDYILNSLRLKQVSGQLQVENLEQVNRWLQ
jgi:outer membrane protein